MSAPSLFADTGLFVWADSVSRRGSASPARKVFVIGRTLAHRDEIVERRSVARNEALVDRAVEAGYARFGNKHLVPLVELRLPEEPHWDPHVAMAELMVADCGALAIRSAKSRLDSSGVRLGYDELHDLSTVFVNAHLRDAVRSFDPVAGEGKEGAWLSTVLFRYALRHGLIARGLEANLELASEIRDPSPEPDEQMELAAEQRSLELLPDALARLPGLQRDALRLYFGFHGREYTIKEVASALGTNAYYARLAVTSGLAGLASELGAVGLLDRGDMHWAKALFVEGRSAQSVAADLGISRSELLRRTSTVARRVSASLRNRTVLPKNSTSPREIKMPNVTVDLPLLRREFRAKRLKFVRNDRGQLLVAGQELRDPIPVELLRHELARQSDELGYFVSELEEEVATIFAPDARENREDLGPDQRQWIDMLARAERYSLEDVAELVATWKLESERLGRVIDADSLIEAEQRVRDSLSTVTSALIESMPRKLRRNGSAVLIVTFGETLADSTFVWEESDPKTSFPTLHSLIRHRLGMVGEFRHQALDVLANCVVAALQSGRSFLPDFESTPSRGSDVVRLTWTRASASPKAFDRSAEKVGG